MDLGDAHFLPGVGLRSVGKVQVVPVSFPRGSSKVVAVKTVLEIVEDSKFVSGHHIGRWLSLDLSPDLCNRSLEDVYNCRVLGSFWTVSGEFESLRNGCGGGPLSYTSIVTTHAH
jgi:hypothetical protein